MLWIIVIDSHVYMMPPFRKFQNLSYFRVAQMLAKSVLLRISEEQLRDYITICSPIQSQSGLSFCEFSRNANQLFMEIDKIPEPTLPLSLPKLSTSHICNILEQVFQYWGPWPVVQILIFTKGDSSVFDESVPAQTADFNPNQYPMCRINLISLTDNHAFNLNTYLTNFTQIIFQSFGINNLSKIPNSIGEEKSHSKVITIRCGWLESLAELLPIHTNLGSIDSSGSLSIEIFGFLNVNDLGNPPVKSRHVVISSEGSSESGFLPLLLTAMQSTKTVAMCNINLVDSDPNGPSAPKQMGRDLPKEKLQLLNHGFLHYYDTKQEVLLLSVFEPDCTSLPWLGQFTHLAPVIDFAGSQLYDDQNEKSPFPVRAADRLSYKSDGSRYVSWASRSSALADISKVLRLGRRLPDKSSLLYKELNRLRFAAQLYGCRELVVQIHDLIQSMHQSNVVRNPTNEDTVSTLSTHLNNVTRLLLNQDNDDPDTHARETTF